MWVAYAQGAQPVRKVTIHIYIYSNTFDFNGEFYTLKPEAPWEHAWHLLMQPI